MRWVSAILVAFYVNLLIAPDALAAKAAASKKSKTAAGTFLEVTGSVPGATVMFDEQVIGETPLKNKAVAAKSGTVTVRKLGFLEFKQKVTVKAGETTKVFADLLPFAGVIHVTSNMSGAAVAVDGKVVGNVPLDYEVKIGTRQITVTVSGYQPFTQTVRANPGETYDLRAAFGSKPGQIAALPLDVEGQAPSSSNAKTDQLALIPLEAPPRDPEIALEPVAQPSLGIPSLVPPAGVGTGGTTELALEGLPGADPVEPGLAPLTVNGRVVTPAKPWYKEWWAIAGASAVVVIGVVAIVAIAKSGGGPEEVRPDASWSVAPPGL